jgi:outer membrane lipoprotein-sorting protein
MLGLPCRAGVPINPCPPEEKRLKFSQAGLAVTLLFSILAVLGVPQVSAAQTAPTWTVDSVLTLMDRSAQDFHSLTANIEHVKYTAVVSDTSTETGQMYVRRDDKMRIDMLMPDKRTVLRNGDSLYIYTPKINRVEEYNLGKNRSVVDQYILLGFGTRSVEVRKSYDVTLTGEDQLDGKKVVILELVPKSEDIRKQITKIQMWIDEASWLPLQQKFYEATAGDYFLFHYTDLKKNLKFPDNKFKQDWPKGVTRVKPGP